MEEVTAAMAEFYRGTAAGYSSGERKTYTIWVVNRYEGYLGQHMPRKNASLSLQRHFWQERFGSKEATQFRVARISSGYADASSLHVRLRDSPGLGSGLRSSYIRTLPIALVMALLFTTSVSAQSGEQTPSHTEVARASASSIGSPYIPVDSWIYPAALRLYYMGCLPTADIGVRP